MWDGGVGPEGQPQDEDPGLDNKFMTGLGALCFLTVSPARQAHPLSSPRHPEWQRRSDRSFRRSGAQEGLSISPPRVNVSQLSSGHRPIAHEPLTW